MAPFREDRKWKHLLYLSGQQTEMRGVLGAAVWSVSQTAQGPEQGGSSSCPPVCPAPRGLGCRPPFRSWLLSLRLPLFSVSVGATPLLAAVLSLSLGAGVRGHRGFTGSGWSLWCLDRNGILSFPWGCVPLIRVNTGAEVSQLG